jgi:NitT/TauT family transport system permease protein
MKKAGFISGTVSTLMMIAVWFIAAVVMDSSFILPTPAAVLLDCLKLVKTQAFGSMLHATFSRGIFAFSISLFCALILGLAGGMYPLFSAALRPWMTTIKATPVVSFILLALLWFGSSKVPVFVSVLMTLPVMTEAIAQGVRSSDRKLLEMAHSYHFSRRDILLHLYIPSALPYFLGGAGASLGLTWKVVVAGEILSSPRFGIGSAMQSAKVHLETSRVFSLTLTAILLSIITELVFDGIIHLSKARDPRTGGR